MEPTDFKRASHEVWEAMAPGWDERHAYFERSARAVAESMLAHAALHPSAHVLELAAGTGLVGLAAATAVPDGRVIISDFSAAMVDAAERHARAVGATNVECRVLDAERLEMDDASVDVVLCRWGLMLMADPAAALAEARRVLRPGGRISAAVFSAAAQNPWAAMPSAVLSGRGHMPPPGPGAPGILALGDRDRLTDLITGAGFATPEIEEVAFMMSFDDADDYWAFLTDAAGALAMVIERLDDDERAQVRAEIAARADEYRVDGAIRFPAACLVAAAPAA
jgi:ubiquinone/menaquinone biosynthesis C-methylase UbiE